MKRDELENDVGARVMTRLRTIGRRTPARIVGYLPVPHPWKQEFGVVDGSERAESASLRPMTV
jgi:hypothetical protein